MGTESMVSMYPAPRARNMPASVTMKGGTASRWIIPPIAAPKRVVIASSSAKAASGCIPVSRSSTAINTPEKAMTDPTDRSIPPEMMTTVIPTATMPR